VKKRIKVGSNSESLRSLGRLKDVPEIRAFNGNITTISTEK
jgi:hypothetical protein